MKKNIAVIYRLAFILFSVWGILESISFDFSLIGVKLLDFTVFSDAVCLLCMLIVVLFSLRGGIGNVLYGIKTACTFLALLAFAANLPMLFSVTDSGWILRILLPLMMLLDHVVFDKNSGLKLWQMLLWLLLAGLIAGIIYVIADKFLNLPNSLDFLGLFNNPNGIFELLLNALVLTGAIYLLDKLFSGELFKDIQSIFAFVFRILFLLLEIWAFKKLSGMNLRTFLNALRYFENMVNFLCFLCIAAVLIFDILRLSLKSKGVHAFARIKVFFTISILFAFVVYHFYVKGAYTPDSVAIVLYYVAPLMMLIDWLFLDTSKYVRGFDPLIWLAFPLVYFLAAILLSYTRVIYLYPAIYGTTAFIFIGVLCVSMLVIGYLFYLIQRTTKRR